MSGSLTPLKPEARVTFQLVTVVVVALLVRATYYFEISSNPFFEVPIVDAETYDQMARRVAEHQDPWPGQAFFQPPLYPYFLGLVYRVFGPEPATARFVQLLLGVVNCTLVFFLARRVFGSPVAFVSGLVFALYGTMLFFEAELLAPALLVSWNTLFLWSAVRFVAKPTLTRAALSGALLGLSALTMAVVLPFAAVLVVWLGTANRKGRGNSSGAKRVPWAPALIFVVAAALVIAPVTWRNLQEGGDRVLISWNAGINFYVGTGADFDHKVGIRPGPKWQELGLEPVRLGIEKPSEQSAYFVRKSLAIVRDDPIEFAGNWFRKLFVLVHGNEVLRNQGIYPFREESSLLSLLVWKYGIAFPFGVLLPLGVVGMALAWSRRPESRVLTLFAVCHVLVILAFFVAARYRVNVLPVLVPSAVFGAWTLARELTDSQFAGKRPWFAFVLLVALGTLANWNVGAMEREYTADSYYNLGVRYMESGDPRAEALLSKALDSDPSNSDTELNLGILAHRRGDLDTAEARFRAVLRREPDHIEANVNLGVLRAYQGRVEEARAQFERVLRLVPGHPQATRSLKRLDSSLGNP